MAAVMIVYVGGQRVSQCDERCYNAEGPACSCCCGGANHGVGLDQAVINSQVMGRRYAEAYAAEQGHALADSRLERPIPEEALVQLREI
jgi:hypothetical protein